MLHGRWRRGLKFRRDLCRDIAVVNAHPGDHLEELRLGELRPAGREGPISLLAPAADTQCRAETGPP
jgi:hypothetical protein